MKATFCNPCLFITTFSYASRLKINNMKLMALWIGARGQKTMNVDSKV